MTSLFFDDVIIKKNFLEKIKKSKNIFFAYFIIKNVIPEKKYFFQFFWSDHLLGNHQMPKVSTFFPKNNFVSMLTIEFPENSESFRQYGALF